MVIRKRKPFVINLVVKWAFHSGLRRADVSSGASVPSPLGRGGAQNVLLAHSLDLSGVRKAPNLPANFVKKKITKTSLLSFSYNHPGAGLVLWCSHVRITLRIMGF